MRTIRRIGLILVIAFCTASAQDAAVTYAGSCAHCHGADGRGRTPLGRVLKLRDLRSPEVQNRTEDDLTEVIGKGSGQGKMPGFQQKLGPDAVRQLASYVRNLSSATPSGPPLPSGTAIVQKSDVNSVYNLRCAHCHGSDLSGNTILGREIGIHDLRSGAARLSDAQLTEIIARGSDGGKMPGFQKKLGAEMIGQLATYVRGLSSTPTIAATASQSKPSNQTQVAVTSPAHSDVERDPIPVFKPEPEGLIDVNSASKEDLMSLPGLTEQDADKIIQCRPYQSTMQFKIRGIIAPEKYRHIEGRVIAKRARKSKSEKGRD